MVSRSFRLSLGSAGMTRARLPRCISPDLLFWYGLALKMAMTAVVVVITSLAVERSGLSLAR